MPNCKNKRHATSKAKKENNANKQCSRHIFSLKPKSAECHFQQWIKFYVCAQNRRRHIKIKRTLPQP